jgi:CubicO group peptidase (beta-lactamase class C family)
MMLHLSNAIVALAFLATTAPTPTTTSAAYDFRPLDQLLARAATEIPRGLEVLIVQDGRQVYWKQFGRWPKDQQVPIASATKWLSGAVIMSLVDSRTLSLDDRASTYLPYLTGDKSTITIRQLMSHTSGFAGEFPLAHRCLGDAADTLDHCARELAAVRLKAAPGTAFIYAGADMQIAARAAEVAAGTDWQTLFRERLAEPLGFTATDYDYRGPTRNPRVSGGGRSSVSDYMKFLVMLQQHGEYDGRRVLSARAVDDMLRDQTAGAAIVESPFQHRAALDPHAAENRYGIGNWLEDLDPSGHATLNSSPGLLGFTPYIDPSRHLEVVVGVQAMQKFQRYYPEMKQILRDIIPAIPAQTATPAPAQGDQARERLQQFADRLQLTPEQREQVRPVMLDEVQRLKAIRDRYQADDGGGANRRTKLKMAREMRNVQKEADDKLKKILTSQQMDELKKIREENRAAWRARTAQ